MDTIPLIRRKEWKNTGLWLVIPVSVSISVSTPLSVFML